MSTSKADIQKTALEVIEKELLAVNALRQSIDGSFLKVVENSIRFKGRLIVTGGKSALIGQKIVASSIKELRPFLCMLPTQFTETWVLYNPRTRLCVFKSGDTAEIKSFECR